jgi:hypothetical protein
VSKCPKNWSNERLFELHLTELREYSPSVFIERYELLPYWFSAVQQSLPLSDTWEAVVEEIIRKQLLVKMRTKDAFERQLPIGH